MAFTNCNEVELFINGKSFGKKKSDPANSCLWWDVPYETGEVNAHSEKIGQQKAYGYAETKFLEPVKLLLTPDATKLKANNKDITIVEVQLP